MKTIKSLLLLFLVLLPVMTAAAEEKPVEFLFPEDTAVADKKMMHRNRGEQAMADGLFIVASRYFQEYCNAVGANEPEATMARAMLAEALVRGGQFESARRIADEWLARPTTVKGSEAADQLLLQKCAAQLKLGVTPETVASLKELAMRPLESQVRFPALQLLNESLVGAGEWSALVSLLEGRLEDYKPGDERRILLHIQMARALVAVGRNRDAAALLEALDKNVPAAAATEVVQLQIQSQAAFDVDKALAIYEGVKNNIPRHSSAAWNATLTPLAKVCFEQGKYQIAAEVADKLQGVADTAECRINAAVLRTESLVKLGQIPAARDVLSRLLENEKSAAANGALVMRLAELKLMNRERRSAAELFASVAGNGKAEAGLRFRAAMQAAENFGREGEVLQAINFYRLAAKLSANAGDTVKAMRMAAFKSIEAGKKEDAAAIYREIAADFGGKVDGAAECRMEAGRLLAEMNKPAEALQEYNRFIADYPDAKTIWEARLASATTRVVLAENDKDKLNALRTELVALAENCTVEEIATQAYFEAVRIADSTGDTRVAMNILDLFCRRFPDSGKSRIAMHRGILLRFQLNDGAQAFALGGEYLRRFSGDASTAEVAMLMGDYKLAEGDFAAARQLYAAAEDTAAPLTVIQLARLEGARCCMKLGDYDAADAKVKTILKVEGTAAELLARTEMLGGDVAASRNDTETARKYFAAARNRAGDTIVGYAALARQAEMLMSGASGNAQRLQEAEKCLNTIVKAPGLPWELWARASFLLGRCAELAGNVDRAIVIYQTLFGKYDADLRSGISRNQTNFCNVGWALAQLLERRKPQNGHKDPEDFRQARRIYAILAETGLPRAAEAGKRAEYLRITHKLGTK